MSGSEEKKLNSLHEEDSLYKAQGGKAAYQISPTYGQNTLYKVNPVHDAWDRALAAESICQDILSSARNQLYLNMRFMDCALSALFFQGDMGIHPSLENSGEKCSVKGCEDRSDSPFPGFS